MNQNNNIKNINDMKKKKYSNKIIIISSNTDNANIMYFSCPNV